MPLKVSSAPLSSSVVHDRDTPAAILTTPASSPSLVTALSHSSGTSNAGANTPIVRRVLDDACPRMNQSWSCEASNSLALQEHSKLTLTSNTDTLSTETSSGTKEFGYGQNCASPPDRPSLARSICPALVAAYSSDPEDDTKNGNDVAVSSKTSGGIIAQSFLKTRSREAMEEQAGDEEIQEVEVDAVDKNKALLVNKREKTSTGA